MHAPLAPRAQVLAHLQALRTAADRPPLEEEPVLTASAQMQAAKWAYLMVVHRRFPLLVPAPEEAPPEETPATNATPDLLAVSQHLPGVDGFFIKLPAESLAEIKGEELIDAQYDQIGVGVEHLNGEPAAIVLLLRPKLPPKGGPPQTP